MIFQDLCKKSDFRRILNQEKTKSGRPKSVFIFSILMILILPHIFFFYKISKSGAVRVNIVLFKI